MKNNKRSTYFDQLVAAQYIVKNLLNQIDDVENDFKSSISDRLVKIKKIKEELSKVGMEIDNIKREIRLLTAYNIN